jgi:hypothetical protein
MTKRSGVAGGTVYLLHFTTPYKHARHYLGATGMPLENRLAAHRQTTEYEGDSSYGRPARLLVAAAAAGVDWVLADVWETTTRAEAFELERALKRQGGRARLCSICSPGNGRGGGKGRYPRTPRDG